MMMMKMILVLVISMGLFKGQDTLSSCSCTENLPGTRVGLE